MSDQPSPEEQETPSGAFGKLNVNDELVEIIRHPANQHLDEKQQDQSEPPPA
jgi:hypothetical protein